MNSIKKLRDYADIRDDWYLKSQLDILEVEIEIVKNQAQIEIYNKL